MNLFTFPLVTTCVIHKVMIQFISDCILLRTEKTYFSGFIQRHQDQLVNQSFDY
jgi:hypothetical protein